MEGRRTRDIDEVRPLAVEHQPEIVIDPDPLQDPEGVMTPLGDRIADRGQLDRGPRRPSGQMALGGDRAEAGYRAAQLHRDAPRPGAQAIQSRAIASSSRSALSRVSGAVLRIRRWAPASR